MKLLTSDIKIPQLCYDEYISIGDRCTTAASLSKLNVKKHAYPFDWIITNPVLILNFIKNKFKDFYSIENMDGYINQKTNISFIHFSSHTHIENYETFNILIKWLYEIFESTQTILFIYTTESQLFSQESRNNEQQYYQGLKDLINYFKEKYVNFKFHILAIHTNVMHENNIKELTNLTIECDTEFMNYNMELSPEMNMLYHKLQIEYQSFVVDIIDKQINYYKK